MPKTSNVAKNLTNQIFAIPEFAARHGKLKERSESIHPADFETAITATGFGRYNLFLILIGIPSGWAPFFATTSMSYVFPAAQCDLDLSLDDKGFLNAITYLGMISSALIWGFLVDTLGRKKLLMAGFLLDAVFVLMSATSQTKTLLMVAKFLGGFIINGPFAAFTSYISEFHSAHYRARIMMYMGIIFSCGSFTLPLVAWAVIPQNLDFFLFDKSLEFHSWNVYLLICALPSMISGIVFMFMPESPKFLMTTGQNEKALKVFQKVYATNSGKPPETYPVKQLIAETEKESDPKSHGGHVTANRTKIQALKEGLQQMKPLLFPPHLKNIVLVCLIQMSLTLSYNTLRLWLPQIFQAINDYQYYNNGTAAPLCEMLNMIQPSFSTDEICVVNTNNDSVYINSIVVAAVCVGNYVMASFLINMIGKKKLISLYGLIAGGSAFAMYFATNTAFVLTFSSLFTATAGASTNIILTIVIDLFPTTLRTMTVSIGMMMARSGALIGNVVFPLLLRAGCAPPFFTLGSIFFFCALMVFLLPNTDNKALE